MVLIAGLLHYGLLLKAQMYYHEFVACVMRGILHQCGWFSFDGTTEEISEGYDAFSVQLQLQWYNLNLGSLWISCIELSLVIEGEKSIMFSAVRDVAGTEDNPQRGPFLT